MDKREEYENYMKRITDSYISMQNGNKLVNWNGGIRYRIESDVGLYSKGITMDEVREYNAEVALQFLKENIMTYEEWCKLYPFNKIRIYKYGLEVFNNEKIKFKRWLLKGNISLDNRKPIDLINNDNWEDSKMVYDYLNRIEYGNFS